MKKIWIQMYPPTYFYMYLILTDVNLIFKKMELEAANFGKTA